MDSSVVVAVITLVGVLITAGVSIITASLQVIAKRHLEDVNDAVNHRHQKGGPAAPKLYDLALDNRERMDRIEGRADRIERHCERTDERVRVLTQHVHQLKRDREREREA